MVMTMMVIMMPEIVINEVGINKTLEVLLALVSLKTNNSEVFLVKSSITKTWNSWNCHVREWNDVALLRIVNNWIVLLFLPSLLVQLRWS